MKIKIEDGRLVIYFTPRIYIHTINDWKHNPADIKVVVCELSFEHDAMLNIYDLTFVIMGLGLSLKVNYFEQM